MERPQQKIEIAQIRGDASWSVRIHKIKNAQASLTAHHSQKTNEPGVRTNLSFSSVVAHPLCVGLPGVLAFFLWGGCKQSNLSTDFHCKVTLYF